jgi:non-specific serine/threonine protein kinase
LAAAEEVCVGEGIEHRDVLDLLTSLADKSLVVPEQEDAQTRYRLLETVRQYARDRLDDTGGRRRYGYGIGTTTWRWRRRRSRNEGAEQTEWLAASGRGA